ncbi:hypothetical protein K469DRAFT_63803 [Zopfia rhizophila CBS 207.26]|uniref:Uncharacterized protein n=1 Tax=Zopfia rhizophila CBS 207.26 TaxID=1314779 RepID=A0A6A6EDQ2_9PEZI|nr:hypothetical protein K469DRAFT_63803 [Zopfia rhizophila CBS 207.26]
MENTILSERGDREKCTALHVQNWTHKAREIMIHCYTEDSVLAKGQILPPKGVTKRLTVDTKSRSPVATPSSLMARRMEKYQRDHAESLYRSDELFLDVSGNNELELENFEFDEEEALGSGDVPALSEQDDVDRLLSAEEQQVFDIDYNREGDVDHLMSAEVEQQVFETTYTSSYLHTLFIDSPSPPDCDNKCSDAFYFRGSRAELEDSSDVHYSPSEVDSDVCDLEYWDFIIDLQDYLRGKPDEIDGTEKDSDRKSICSMGITDVVVLDTDLDWEDDLEVAPEAHSAPVKFFDAAIGREAEYYATRPHIQPDVGDYVPEPLPQVPLQYDIPRHLLCPIVNMVRTEYDFERSLTVVDNPAEDDGSEQEDALSDSSSVFDASAHVAPLRSNRLSKINEERSDDSDSDCSVDSNMEFERGFVQPLGTHQNNFLDEQNGDDTDSVKSLPSSSVSETCVPILYMSEIEEYFMDDIWGGEPEFSFNIHFSSVQSPSTMSGSLLNGDELDSQDGSGMAFSPPDSDIEAEIARSEFHFRHQTWDWRTDTFKIPVLVPVITVMQDNTPQTAAVENQGPSELNQRLLHATRDTTFRLRVQGIS